MTMACKNPEPVKVLFFGDSITYNGVSWEGAYVRLIESYASNDGLDHVEFVASGIPGNKVTDLYARYERDVVSQDPDYVVLFIGVNDIWHDLTGGQGTDYDTFTKVYFDLVQKLQSADISMVLCTPTCIGEQKDFVNEGDKELNRISQWIREFANSKHIPLVDLRTAFLKYQSIHNIENVSQGLLTADGVHLKPEGSKLVADEMWKIIGEILNENY